MDVSILESTRNADRLAAATARGDYMSGSLVDTQLHDTADYNEIIKSVNHDTLNDRELAVDWWDNTMGALDGESNSVGETAIENHAKTRGLLRDLIRKGHFGPFEHPRITLAIEGISRSCMAQMTRHRHASFDVQSMRYVDFEEAEMITPESFKEATVVTEPVEYGIEEYGKDMTDSIMDEQVRLYRELLDKDVPKEDTRMVLPIGTKVNCTASFNARALMHVVDMRLAGDAQWEARELAEEMFELAKDWAPITFEMYDEYAKGSSKKAP